VSPKIRIALVIALFVLALVAPVLMVLGSAAPVLAVDMSLFLRRAALWGSIGIVATGVLLALAWPPFLPGIRLGLRRALARMGTDQRPYYEALARLEHLETAKGHLDVARMAHHMGNLRRALPHAVRAVELDPDLAAARFLLVRVLREVGQLEEAERQARIVVRDDRDHAFGAAQVELGRILLQAGKPEEAIEVLREHDRTNAATRASAALLGQAYQRSGDRDRAREWMERAARQPDDGEHMPPEDALVRAKARVWLRGGGGAR